MSTTTSTAVEEVLETTGATDVLDTPELKVPPQSPQAHQGEITGVTIFEADSGSVAIEIGLTSLNTGSEDTFRLFVPTDFVDNIGVNPSELPSEDGNNQLQQYRIGISNTDKDATLQILRRIALAQGRGAVLEGVARPTNFEGYVNLLNELLSGTQLIYVKAPDKKNDDPRFRKFLRVTGRFHDPADAENPKMFKRAQKMWE